jgi:iron complex transport system permease protein
MTRGRAQTVLLALLLASVLCFGLAAWFGSVSLSPAASLAQWQALLAQLWQGNGEDMTATLLGLRLQRAASAFVIGASLALAGAMMQALLRNPLADPYVLGVSAGAAVGALAAMLLTSVAWVIDSAAFGGAISVSFLLVLLARRDLRSGVVAGSSSLLLTGVMLSSLCMALVTLMLSLAPEGRLRGMVFWMIGDVSGSQLRLLPCVVLVLAWLYAQRVARALNVLALHAENAVTLGVRVASLRQGLFVCAALLTASSVSSAGSIGFVGLIVPHACRHAFGPDHRLLLPAASLAGGAFLVLADTLARTVAAPLQLPVGVVTALIGVPMFLIQLHQVRRSA